MKLNMLNSVLNYQLFIIIFINRLLQLKKLPKQRISLKKHAGYETNIGLCDNLIGLACTHLKQFEEAEEHFITAINTFKKIW